MLHSLKASPSAETALFWCQLLAENKAVCKHALKCHLARKTNNNGNVKALIPTIFGYMKQNKPTWEIVGDKDFTLFGPIFDTNLQLRKSIPMIIHMYSPPPLIPNYCHTHANPTLHFILHSLTGHLQTTSPISNFSKYQPSTYLSGTFSLFFAHDQTNIKGFLCICFQYIRS